MPRLTDFKGCELLQNVYLCSGKHNFVAEYCFQFTLWIASKCVSLQWQAQWIGVVQNLALGCELLQNVYLCSGKHNVHPCELITFWRCELLQNVYLCSGKHNISLTVRDTATVVNCFKMCIFAVASTIRAAYTRKHFALWIASKCVSLQWQAQYRANRGDNGNSCELLQNVYLCSGKHNYHYALWVGNTVVNCFKMCIFAVASTIWLTSFVCETLLWIASKCVSLQWQAQYIIQRYFNSQCCELLQNVYLCSGKHNLPCCEMVSLTLWIASKCVSLQWQAQLRVH